MSAQHRPAPSRPTLDRLTSLRAFAALSVFAFHLHRWAVWGPAKVADFGFVGVGFFFVLSGFILVWSTAPDTATTTFYRRRFARIYPSHLAVFLFAVAVPAVTASRGLVPGLLSVSLLQTWAPSNYLLYGFNGVSWSLGCEMFFYALFPILLVAMSKAGKRTLAVTVLAAYAVASCLVLAGAVVTQNSSDPAWGNIITTNPLLRLPEFMLGMAVGLAFRQGWRPRIDLRVALGALVAIYVVALAVHLPDAYMDPILPLDFVAIILAAATLDLSGSRSWLTSRWMIYAGQVSFCFYLVHERVIVGLRSHIGGLAGSVLMLLVAALAAVALHHLVEVPGQRLLRPRGKPAVGSEAYDPVASSGG